MCNCTGCGKKIENIEPRYILLKNENEKFCISCYQTKGIDRRHEKSEKESGFLVTINDDIQGYKITKYKGVQAGCIVLEKDREEIEEVKDDAVLALLEKAEAVGADAVIGIDFDYITLSNHMLGVIATGTPVDIEKTEYEE